VVRGVSLWPEVTKAKTYSLNITLILLVWPVLLALSVNPLQNRETQHVNVVLQCMYQFLEQPNMKGNQLELNGNPSSVIAFSTDFSFQNLVWWNLFEFPAVEITLKSISPTF
jgi:hypothetical protein